jgi:Fe-S-cluster containining protein
VVAGPETSRQLLEKVAEIYLWLQKQISSAGATAGKCRSCGDCCDFEGFDHRLFVTQLELIFLEANLGAENIKPMSDSRCPYNIDGKCTIYEYRFAGCRIFCCNGDTDLQSKLSEEVLKKLKSTCVEFQIPYRYTELAAGLNSLTGV